MSTQRILLLVLVVLSGITATLLIKSNSDSAGSAEVATESAQTPAAVSSSAHSSQSKAPEPVQPVPIQEASGTVQYDSATEDDDAVSDQEAVNAALAEVGSAEVEKRIEAVEQLGAYPTAEAELALAQALASDSKAEVRSAAAQSLGYVEKPGDATLDVLFSALEDRSGEVRESALSTLEDFLFESEEGSNKYKRVLEGLKAKMESRSVPAGTRKAIQEIFEDLDAPE